MLLSPGEVFPSSRGFGVGDVEASHLQVIPIMGDGNMSRGDVGGAAEGRRLQVGDSELPEASCGVEGGGEAGKDGGVEGVCEVELGVNG